MSDHRVVGKALPRIDAFERVTGQARYTADFHLPGMLYAQVLRSPYPHARIKSIDTREAERLPGVLAVLHYENAKVRWRSGDRNEKRFIFNNPARYVGDAIAAVAARSRHVAEEAVAKIKVEFEPLAFVLDHETAFEAGMVDGEPLTYSRGDVEKGLQEADLVYEGRFTSEHHNNAQLEPRVAIAAWEGDQLTVWTPTQGVSNCRSNTAADLGIPLSKVRIVAKYMGGGFGNKNQNHDFELMAAALARATRRPVCVEFSRKEDFIAVHGRWPTTQHYRIGVKNDGAITAIRLRGISGMGPYRKGSGDIAGRHLYHCENVKTEVFPVLTNKTTSANFRAPSYPQGIFGLESAMDEIAYRLKMNPLDFRLKNFARTGEGHLPFTSSALEACIRRGAEKIDWRSEWAHPDTKRERRRSGLGMAIGGFGSRVGMSAAHVRVNRDGSVQVLVGVTDIGTGAKTVMAQIAAEVLGLTLDDLEVINGDTEVTPYSVGESGSRTTTYTGTAVLEAARDALRQMADHAARKLEVKDVEFKGGRFASASDPARSLSFKEAAGLAPDSVLGRAAPSPQLAGAVRESFAAHFVKMEVDTLTGELAVVRYVAMHDSGTIINPLTATSQIKGGVLMGLSIALHEELTWDPRTGVPLNAGYYGAKVVTHRDAPTIEVEFIEPEDAYGPFGAKAVGEVPITPVVAAVANAIYNAAGLRLRSMPMTRDKIIAGLHGS